MEYSTKQAGSLYEQIFVVEAMRRGLEPHLPIGDFLPHDVVVYGGGVCWRVQVKGTATESRDERRRNLRGRFRITAATGMSTKKIIDCRHVDILAAYIAPWDLWYLIPCEEIKSKCCWFYPDQSPDGSKHGKPPSGKFEKFKNDWEVFS